MNHTLQTGLAWFGALNALGYLTAGIWLGIVSALEARRLETEHAARRTKGAPLTELDSNSTDLDAELIQLLKGDSQ